MNQEQQDELLIQIAGKTEAYRDLLVSLQLAIKELGKNCRSNEWYNNISNHVWELDKRIKELEKSELALDTNWSIQIQHRVEELERNVHTLSVEGKKEIFLDKPQNSSDDFTQSTDAVKWAEAFMRNINQYVDRDVLIGYFANAIERGRTAGIKEGKLAGLEEQEESVVVYHNAVHGNETHKDGCFIWLTFIDETREKISALKQELERSSR